MATQRKSLRARLFDRPQCGICSGLKRVCGMSFLDPWQEIEENVRRLRITEPYDRYLQNRVNVIADLFEADTHSIDAIALAGISLGALAEVRFAAEVPKHKRKEKNQICFRELLTNHCPSFVNRMSIPELLQACTRDKQYRRQEAAIRSKYVSETLYSVRVASEDPLAVDFDAWADKQKPLMPDTLRSFDYAGCIHKHYRNAVIHELRVAGGREADYFGEGAHDGPIYYISGREDVNSSEDALSEDTVSVAVNAYPVEQLRFGIYPPYLLELLREAITSVREWSLANDRNLFSDEVDDG